MISPPSRIQTVVMFRSHCQVYLLPDGLVKKRLWSKKYPICIELPKKGMSVEKKDPEQVRMTDLDAKEWGFDVVKKEECDDQVLYLFARTGREKEEWFWKFELASKYQKVKGYRPIPTLHKNVFLTGNELMEAGGGQYLYRAEPDDLMARKGTVDFYKFVSKVLPKDKDAREAHQPPPAPSSQPGPVKAGGSVTYASPARKQVPKGESGAGGGGMGESPAAWINAFVGRMFWDFLREDYWADIVKGKLQKKLSKLKVKSYCMFSLCCGREEGRVVCTSNSVTRVIHSLQVFSDSSPSHFRVTVLFQKGK